MKMDVVFIVLNTDGLDVGSKIHRIIVVDEDQRVLFDGELSTQLENMLDNANKVVSWNGEWVRDLLRGAGIYVPEIESLAGPMTDVILDLEHNLSQVFDENDGGDTYDDDGSIPFKTNEPAFLKLDDAWWRLSEERLDKSDPVRRAQVTALMYSLAFGKEAEERRIRFASIAADNHAKRVAAMEREDAQPLPYVTAPVYQPPLAATSQYKSQKSWIATLLLALFLGVFGAHRFYLGKMKSAFVMLLTAGGIGVWWIADIITIIMCRMTDSKNRAVIP